MSRVVLDVARLNMCAAIKFSCMPCAIKFPRHMLLMSHMEVVITCQSGNMTCTNLSPS